MAKSKTNHSESVHQRLLNKAKESSRPFNELLQYFAIERFIYRLSKSPYADQFILKGALMFFTWCGPASRPTMDIDILGKIDDRIDTITTVMKDACLTDVEPDGISFDAKTVEAVRICGDSSGLPVRRWRTATVTFGSANTTKKKNMVLFDNFHQERLQPVNLANEDRMAECLYMALSNLSSGCTLTIPSSKIFKPSITNQFLDTIPPAGLSYPHSPISISTQTNY